MDNEVPGWAEGHVPQPIGKLALDEYQQRLLAVLVRSNYHVRTCSCGELLSGVTVDGLRESYIEHLADIESGEDLRFHGN